MGFIASGSNAAAYLEIKLLRASLEGRFLFVVLRMDPRTSSTGRKSTLFHRATPQPRKILGFLGGYEAARELVTTMFSGEQQTHQEDCKCPPR